MAIQMGFGPGDFDMKTWRAVAAEFIATGLFVFLGTATVVVVQATLIDPGSALIVIALAHGLAFAMLIAAIAHVSGGHINPAITFAAVMTGRLKVSTGALYVIGQLIASVLAVLLLKGIIAGPMEGMLGAHGLSLGILDDQLGDGAGAGLLLEAVLTFTLVFVFFATAIDPRGNKTMAPLAIGLVVLVGYFVAVPLTGASMNPARSFGPAIVANVWTDHWIYWLGPLIGAALAALTYEFVFLQREEEDSAVADAV
ncbi:MAG: MIP family channel protein [Chloroflexi bacterium]|nr:MIP family channel protein [Chloroflexota bacterium]MCI0889258.1 MIP family channel protein [Chloroflexota bacterium]